MAASPANSLIRALRLVNRDFRAFSGATIVLIIGSGANLTSRSPRLEVCGVVQFVTLVQIRPGGAGAAAWRWSERRSRIGTDGLQKSGWAQDDPRHAQLA